MQQIPIGMGYHIGIEIYIHFGSTKNYNINKLAKFPFP